MFSYEYAVNRGVVLFLVISKMSSVGEEIGISVLLSCLIDGG